MFISDNIDLEQVEKYILNIRISSSSFSFFIQNFENKNENSYNEQSFNKEIDIVTEVQQIIFENNFLTLPFYRTSVIFVSEDYEFVPNYLLEKNKKETLYNFSHSKKYKRVLQSNLNICNIVTIFGVNDKLYDFVTRSLFNPQFYHHSSLILFYIKNDLCNRDINESLVLNCHGQYIDIFSFDINSTITYNLTLFQNSDLNCIYSIMNIWTKLNLNQEKNKLYIIRESNDSKEILINSLEKYIRNIRLIDFNAEIKDLLEYSENGPSLDLITIRKTL